MDDREDFHSFIQTSKLYALELTGNKIKQSVISSKYTWCQRSKDELKRIRRQIYGTPIENKHYSLSTVTSYLPTVLPNKRIFVKKKNRFVVKKYFTEGIQCVPEGKVHIYEPLGNQPIDIFEFSTPLPIKSLCSNYDEIAKRRRIRPGHKVIKSSHSYYVVVAPCHSSFKKIIRNSNTRGNIAPIPLPYMNQFLPTIREWSAMQANVFKPLSNSSGLTSAAGLQPTRSRIVRDMRCDNPSDFKQEESGGALRFMKERSAMQANACVHLPGSSGLTCTTKPQPRMSQVTLDMKCDNRSNFKQEKCDDRRRERSPVPRKNAVQDPEVVLMDTYRDSGIGNPSVSEIRKDSCIKYYRLHPHSTFKIQPDGLLSGSFTIHCADANPCFIEYVGEGEIIRSVAYFENKSTFHASLVAPRYLLEYLRDPNEMDKEKGVIEYFYNCVLKKIETVHKAFIGITTRK
ncbi:uncharacterized protein NPIL_316131 [Nephila pilipes]|uniref:Uncharacterized protein n=1 Tax=Nephila pilipes TaxID=299642 RepID=A0A8X6THY0_NEPPI|nr:uncharacterized protein NPIL_316131 [Nephila pilipes]